uniref:AlNc14C10G1256 protein n=1 Tax=Albugo laibachii Nc14 TaxID=890382 RepID=F0W2K9_9STRA|nr:AlNc14C10G1256 [Albugo laibachii Nc14]|eukprot:CCA15295.1 AlNc14C10G1256 [Albugo laibachii Nc14]
MFPVVVDVNFQRFVGWKRLFYTITIYPKLTSTYRRTRTCASMVVSQSFLV